jgi:hypothetical protein
MESRNINDRLRLVASFALVGAVSVGAVMPFLPIEAPFDLRSIGAVVGGGLAAIRLFHLV